MKHLVRETHEERISRKKPRPKNPNSPPLPLEQLAGLYRNLGYGDIELCHVSRRSRAESESCRKLLDEQPVALPGAINDDDVPTLLARWDKYWYSHVKFEHFDGAIFNLTGLDSRPTDDESDPYWTGTTWGVGDEVPTAEFVVDADGNVGFGITGKSRRNVQQQKTNYVFTCTIIDHPDHMFETGDFTEANISPNK
ncbi:hypothetical protein MPER_02695, partial [Moniliophthora perniciosa FA553]